MAFFVQRRSPGSQLTFTTGTYHPRNVAQKLFRLSEFVVIVARDNVFNKMSIYVQCMDGSFVPSIVECFKLAREKSSTVYNFPFYTL